MGGFGRGLVIRDSDKVLALRAFDDVTRFCVVNGKAMLANFGSSRCCIKIDGRITNKFNRHADDVQSLTAGQNIYVNLPITFLTSELLLPQHPWLCIIG